MQFTLFSTHDVIIDESICSSSQDPVLDVIRTNVRDYQMLHRYISPRRSWREEGREQGREDEDQWCQLVPPGDFHRRPPPLPAPTLSTFHRAQVVN